MSETGTIIIYGASDDLVEFEGAIDEEFEAYRPWAGLLTAPSGETLIVRAEFCKRGSDAEWTLAVENTGTLTEWPIRFGERPDFEGDPALYIVAPEGTSVTELGNE